jgi:WD40 repeat protein
MTTRRSRSGRLATVLAIALLAAACARGEEPAATGTPPPVTQPPASTATPTPGPVRPIEFTAPADEGPSLLDLVVFDAGNLDRLAPFKELPAGGLPDSISAANLAFYPSYEYQLAGHLDDGQLLVWNLSTGEAIYQDQFAGADSFSGQHPALALDPSFQRYLATSEAAFPESGPATAVGTVLRTPDDPQTSWLLPGAAVWREYPEAGIRITAIAFSPDGQRMATSVADGRGGYVQIWDIADQDQSGLIEEVGFDQAPAEIAFMPDGSTLVCAVGEELVYLDPIDGRELQRRSFEFTILGLTFGSDAETVAVWGEGRALIETAGLPAALQIPAVDVIRRVQFSPDGRLAFAADGDLLRAWDLSAGAELVSHQGPADFLDVRILDNGRVLATIDTQAQVYLWGVSGRLEMPESLARITPGNTASLSLGAARYVPGSHAARLTANTNLLAIETFEGIYLAELPSMQLRQLLPLYDLSYTYFDISADGAWLAWLSAEETISIWNLQEDRLERELSGLGEGCCSQVLLTPDGVSLVTLAGQRATVWDLATGSETYSRADVQQVHVSPDGFRLAFESGVGFRVSIWDRRTRQDVRQLTGFETAAPLYGIRFSPDWSSMYWAARASMQFSEVGTGALGAFVPFSWGEFSPHGDRIVVVEDGWIYATVGQAHLLDARSGATLAVLDHHTDSIIRAAAYSPDGRLIATGLGQTIKIWNASSGAELATLPPAGGSVHDLAFSPDQHLLLSMSEGDLVELWVVPGRAEPAADVIGTTTAGSLAPLDSLQLEETATDAVFSPDGSDIAVSTASGAIWFWDQSSGQAIQGPSQHGDWIYRLAYNPTGIWLASVSKDGTLRYRGGPGSIDAGTGRGEGELAALAFLADRETVATSGEDGMLRFWDLTSARLALTMPAHSAWVWGLAISPTGDLLATASADRTVKLWSVGRDASGAPQLSLLTTLTGHTAAVWGVAFDPDGRTLASASWDETVRLWDVGSGEQLAVLEGHTDWVYDVSYSPAGDVLASSSADGTVRLWDAVTGEPLAVLEGSGGRIWSVDFSPDGRFLVSASDGGEVTMWGVVQ